MRIKEIVQEGVDPAGQKLIKDTLYQMAREGNKAASEFSDSKKHRIVGDENLVKVKFMLGNHPRAAGSMSFVGSGTTEDEI